MPGAISLAATHKGKIRNIRHQALRDQQQSGMPKKSFALTFEKITRKYDEQMKQASGDSKGIWFKVPHNCVCCSHFCSIQLYSFYTDIFTNVTIDYVQVITLRSTVRLVTHMLLSTL